MPLGTRYLRVASGRRSKGPVSDYPEVEKTVPRSNHDRDIPTATLKSKQRLWTFPLIGEIITIDEIYPAIHLKDLPRVGFVFSRRCGGQIERGFAAIAFYASRSTFFSPRKPHNRRARGNYERKRRRSRLKTESARRPRSIASFAPLLRPPPLFLLARKSIALIMRRKRLRPIHRTRSTWQILGRPGQWTDKTNLAAERRLRLGKRKVETRIRSPSTADLKFTLPSDDQKL